MIEVGINQTWEENGEAFSRTVGVLQLDEHDPTAAIRIIQPIDMRTLAALVRALRGIAADYAQAVSDFGDPGVLGEVPEVSAVISLPLRPALDGGGEGKE